MEYAKGVPSRHFYLSWIEILYTIIDQHHLLPGVQLTEQVNTKTSGYADDTTVYLRHPREEYVLLEIVAEFAAVSGLQVNLGKCIVMRLADDDDESFTTVHIPAAGALPRSPGGVATMYQNGLENGDPADPSPATPRQHQDHRPAPTCSGSRAVILPKLLFVARHYWPSPATVVKLQKLLHTYVWHNTLTAEALSQRAKMSHHAAVLPLRVGGIALPDLKTEVMKLSAKTTYQWTTASSVTSRAVGAVLQDRSRRVHTFSSRAEPDSVTVAATAADTGAAILRHGLAVPQTADECTAIDILLPAAGRGNSDIKRWSDDWLECSYDHLRPELQRVVDFHSPHGELCITALLDAPADLTGILRFPSMPHSVRLSHIASAGDRIGDIVQIQWVRPGTVRFHCLQRLYPLARDEATTFRAFCDILVFNYPQLLFQHTPADVLRTSPPTLERWRLSRDEHRISLRWEPTPSVSEDLGVVTNMQEAKSTARARVAGVSFVDHPWLQPVISIWPATATQHPVRLALSLLTHRLHRRGYREVTGRLTRSATEHPALHEALASLTWQDIVHLPHSTSAQRLLLHQVRSLRLNGWDRLHRQRGCPHCPESGVTGGAVNHIVWGCDMAQRIWLALRDWWRARDLLSSTDLELPRQLMLAIISLQLPRIPASIWSMPCVRRVPLHEIPSCVIFNALNVCQKFWMNTLESENRPRIGNR